MEMVFRRIEYWIDGDRGKQIRLEKQSWNADKIRKRLLKWFAVFLLISFYHSKCFFSLPQSEVDVVIDYITDGSIRNMLGTLFL